MQVWKWVGVLIAKQPVIILQSGARWPAIRLTRVACQAPVQTPSPPFLCYSLSLFFASSLSPSLSLCRLPVRIQTEIKNAAIALDTQIG